MRVLAPAKFAKALKPALRPITNISSANNICPIKGIAVKIPFTAIAPSFPNPAKAAPAVLNKVGSFLNFLPNTSTVFPDFFCDSENSAFNPN